MDEKVMFEIDLSLLNHVIIKLKSLSWYVF